MEGSKMTKGEIRAQRKAAREAGRPWNLESIGYRPVPRGAILPLLQAAAEAHVRSLEAVLPIERIIADADRPVLEREAAERIFNSWLWRFFPMERPTITLADAEALLAEIELEVKRVRS